LPGLYALLLPGIPLCLRYFKNCFDLYTINGFRQLTGSLVLLVLAYLYQRKALIAAFRNLRQLTAFLLLAAINVVALYVYTVGLFMTSATMSQIICVLMLPLTVLLAVIFFPDERELTRKKGFWIGMALSLVGMLGISLASGRISTGNTQGIIYLLLYVGIAVGFGMIIKRMVESIPVLTLTAVSTFWIGLIYTIFSFIWGKPANLLHSPVIAGFMLLSGIYGVFVGGGMAYAITKDLGVIIYQFTNLVLPFVTAILEFLIFRKTLTWPQIAFGVLMVLGCVVILWSSRYGSAPQTRAASTDKKLQTRDVEYSG